MALLCAVNLVVVSKFRNLIITTNRASVQALTVA